ncbi:MAG: efflux RND transporter periplasmic adaptor subunit [Pseudomonadota bacterium]
MKHALSVARTALVVGVLGATLWACESAEEAAQETPLRTVKVTRVKALGDVSNRTFSGTVSSTKETSLSFRVSGTVIEKAVAVADKVEKGNVLAKLDPAPYELEVQRSIASLQEARSTARNAKSSFERTKRLYEAGNSSREDLDDAKTELNSAAAQESASAKELELAQLDLEYTRLVSEDSCAIASTDLQVGENVQQGQEVMVANCGDGLEVDLGIPERFIGQVQKGASAMVAFPALPSVVLEGIVDDVGISATSGETTFPVTVNLPDTDREGVSAGLSAQVTFQFRSQTVGQDGAKALIVPSFSVGEDQSGRFVYIVEAADDGIGIVKRKAVNVGALTDEGVEILSGLEEGALIVTAGVSALRDGVKVRYPDV